MDFSRARLVGILGAIASAGWIAGALVHRWLLRGMSAKVLLTLSIVLGTLSAASFLLLADPVTAPIWQDRSPMPEQSRRQSQLNCRS